MPRFRHIALAGLTTLGIMLTASPSASAFELTGAWANDPDLCEKVFNKKDNQIVFSEFSELYGSGFIVEGNVIRGKSARCTIKSKNESGADIEIVAACTSSIMNQEVEFNLKVIDDNNLDRLFPDISGMSLRYARCSL